MKPLKVLILAAGKGTRMQSSIPKVLHLLKDKPLVNYVIETAQRLMPVSIWVVVGYKAEDVKRSLQHYSVNYVYQEKQLGTGHAVRLLSDEINSGEGSNEDFTLLILYGDVPLISVKTLETLVEKHNNDNADVTVLTAILNNPTGYGRIIKSPEGSIMGIKEEKDADDVEKSIKEINTGIYSFKSKFLTKALKYIKNDNAQKEYYLTDVICFGFNNSYNISEVSVDSPHEVMGVNTVDDLKTLETKLNNIKE